MVKYVRCGIDIEDTGINRMPLYQCREAIDKFNRDAKEYPHWVIKTSKWYDPEGLNIPDKDFDIQFAGTLQECKDKLRKIKDEAMLDGDWQVVDNEGTDFVTIYYPHAISKATFTIIKNPHKPLPEGFSL